MKKTTSDQPCEICGDIGFAHVIVTCSRCHNSREHIYCMRPNLLEVPESWHCEACRFLLDGPKRYCQEEIQNSSKRQKACDTKCLPSKVPDASKRFGSQFKSSRRLLSRNFIPKKVETGKVKFLSLEDIHMRSLKDKPKPPPLHGSRCSQMSTLGVNHVATPKRTSVALAASAKSPLGKGRDHNPPEQTTPVVNCRPQTSPLHKQFIKLPPPLDHVKSTSGSPCHFSTPNRLKGSEIITTKDKRHIRDASHHSPLNKALVVYGVQEKCELKNALSGSRTGKVDSSLSKNYACKVEPVKAIVCCREDGIPDEDTSFKLGVQSLPNPPAIKASWKGSFEILGFPPEQYDGFLAYPPGRVSRKAYLVSKQMPSVLHFILKPRRDVWPERFHKGSPSGFDIALYFWADDICRSSEKYKHLVELMEKRDLSMQSHLDGAELLIFTSRQLPAESQTMKKQFYLWGVFLSLKGRNSPAGLRGKKHAVDLPLLPYRITEDPMNVTGKVDDDQAVDMEIDMEGGRELDNIDKCLRRNSMAAATSGAVLPKVDSQKIKREKYDDFESPGCSRAANNVARFSRPIASPLVNKSPVAISNNVRIPPGFFPSGARVKPSPGFRKQV